MNNMTISPTENNVAEEDQYERMYKILRQIFDQLYYRSVRLWLQLLPEMNWDEEVRALQRELDETLAAMRNQDISTIGLIRRNSISVCAGRIKKYLGGTSELEIENPKKRRVQ